LVCTLSKDCVTPWGWVHNAISDSGLHYLGIPIGRPRLSLAMLRFIDECERRLDGFG
jgi:hypothetical protein